MPEFSVQLILQRQACHVSKYKPLSEINVMNHKKRSANPDLTEAVGLKTIKNGTENDLNNQKKKDEEAMK